MKQIKIEGGIKLSGTINVGGAKNSAVALVPASILSDEEIVIDNIPELAKRWPDGRVRTHFNQYGAQTGRLSSSDPLNFQNIPSHEKSIRMLFKAKSEYFTLTDNDLSEFDVENSLDVETSNGWKSVKDLKIGDDLITDEGKFKLLSIKYLENNIIKLIVG